MILLIPHNHISRNRIRIGLDGVVDLSNILSVMIVIRTNTIDVEDLELRLLQTIDCLGVHVVVLDIVLILSVSDVFGRSRLVLLISVFAAINRVELSG